MTFRDMCAHVGIKENDLYNNEDNTQEKADDHDDDKESRIDIEEDMAKNDNPENAFDKEGDVEVFKKALKIVTTK